MTLTYAVHTAHVAPHVAGPADLPGLSSTRTEYWRHSGEDGLTSVGTVLRSGSPPVVISRVLSLDTSLEVLLLLVRDAEVACGSDELSLRVGTVRGQRAAGDARQT